MHTRFKNTYFFLVLILIFSVGCKSKENPAKLEISNKIEKVEFKTDTTIGLSVAAERFSLYLSLLRGKKVGIIANQGSVVKGKSGQMYVHLVDTLLSLDVNIVKVFSPEHGFRGKADAGELISDETDAKTGLKIISLYGNNKKPKAEQLKDVDILLFDLQDVGVRFYTYISTLHYVMQAAAEHKIPLIVLDRPNPNAQYIDGPVLQEKYKSFVGMHSVPVVYGMTIGEYALMINGENWLQNKWHCNLKVIENQNYTHNTKYILPVKPSPNLPNAKAVNLYPSLCFFEGTNISCGRGTEMQFQIFGSPDLPATIYPFQFIPQPNEGAKHPLFEGKTCYGLNLENQSDLDFLNLQWLADAYKNYPDKNNFFTNYFDTLAGNSELKNQIILGYSMDDIRKTWQPDLEKFKKIRNKYLLYP